MVKAASSQPAVSRKKRALPKSKLVKVRLVFEDEGSRAEIRDWVSWFVQSGVEVLGSNHRSIDIQGGQTELENALAAPIHWDQPDCPAIGNVGRVIGKSGIAPLAYVPRTPTPFP